MDGHKLTRTHSSLLRSSPTFRSSIHSLSSITEGDLSIFHQKVHEERDVELESGEKERRKPLKKCGSRPRTGLNLIPFNPVFGMVSLSFLGLLSFFFFLHSRSEEILTSENLLLVLIFIAVTLFLASKHISLINQILTTIKQICEENTKRLGFYPKTRSKPVQWFIGESKPRKTKTLKEKSLIKEGVEFYSNGDFYEGEFHKGKCNGNGVYNYFVNGRYEGDWVDGRYDGYGIESWARGSRYKGQYRQGLRHGYGAYRFYTGDCYTGEWFNGQSHGFGVQTCADGSSYVGEFKFGVKHGLGCYHFRNGDKYAGEYFGDKINGFGVYRFSNGHSYEGAWHEGLKQGYGVYAFRNGDTKSGEWDAGNLKTPLPHLSVPVLGAVKAAKRTAEKAVNLRTVEEQVSRAVSAANKAATAARVAAVKAVQNQMDGTFCDTEV